MGPVTAKTSSNSTQLKCSHFQWLLDLGLRTRFQHENHKVKVIPRYNRPGLKIKQKQNKKTCLLSSSHFSLCASVLWLSWYTSMWLCPPPSSGPQHAWALRFPAKGKWKSLVAEHGLQSRLLCRGSSPCIYIWGGVHITVHGHALKRRQLGPPISHAWSQGLPSHEGTKANGDTVVLPIE